MVEKYFFFDESPFSNKFYLRFEPEKAGIKGTKGSYNVMPARLLGLSYADYLRYARDKLGAELIGKNTKYVVPYFEKDNTTKMFVKLLNARMSYVLNERDFPFDYKEEEGKVLRVPFEGNDSDTRNSGEV